MESVGDGEGLQSLGDPHGSSGIFRGVPVSFESLQLGKEQIDLLHRLVAAQSCGEGPDFLPMGLRRSAVFRCGGPIPIQSGGCGLLQRGDGCFPGGGYAAAQQSSGQ